MANYDAIEKVIEDSVKRSKGGVPTKVLWKKVKAKGLTTKYFDMLKVIREMNGDNKVNFKGKKVYKGSHVDA